VVRLNSDIPLKELMDCFEETLNKRNDQTVSTSILVTLLPLVLLLKIFKFRALCFKQLIGTAIGTKIAPTFAKIFMVMIDKKILKT
jgi:hypothetical protein